MSGKVRVTSGQSSRLGALGPSPGSSPLVPRDQAIAAICTDRANRVRLNRGVRHGGDGQTSTAPDQTQRAAVSNDEPPRWPIGRAARLPFSSARWLRGSRRLTVQSATKRKRRPSAELLDAPVSRASIRTPPIAGYPKRPPEGSDHRVPISRCVSAAGLRFLGHPVPAKELGLPHGRHS
jgi:hypothetical protein